MEQERVFYMGKWNKRYVNCPGCRFDQCNECYDSSDFSDDENSVVENYSVDEEVENNSSSVVEEQISNEEQILKTSSSAASTQSSLDSFDCKICYSEQMNILFEPCKHVVVCDKCVVNLTMCPICRHNIFKNIRIFLS